MTSRSLTAAGLIAVLSLVAACGKTEPEKASSAAGAPAAKAGPFKTSVVIENHKFSPEEIVIPANTPVEINVTNKDKTAEEFEALELHIEKVIAGGGEGTVRIRGLEPGRYPFVGEFHASTAKGVIVAQ